MVEVPPREGLCPGLIVGCSAGAEFDALIEGRGLLSIVPRRERRVGPFDTLVMPFPVDAGRRATKRCGCLRFSPATAPPQTPPPAPAN